MENSKLINQINQLFHNKGVKQEDRFNLLMTLLEKNNIKDEKYNDILSLIMTDGHLSTVSGRWAGNFR